MSRQIVEVHFSRPPEGNSITYYFVMTGLAGYVNAYTGIIQRPNAQSVFNADRPLGQHSLQVRLVGETCRRTGRFSLHMVHGMG